ncbi:MAG: hypothetical protein M3171_03255 [Actinomycetota bacterium]|nr:hypothetical protein [Actinomycetota bacterium]
MTPQRRTGSAGFRSPGVKTSTPSWQAAAARVPIGPRLPAWGTCLGVGGAFAHTVFVGISMLELAMAVEVHRSDLWALEAGSGQSGKVTVPSATRTAGPDSSTR